MAHVRQSRPYPDLGFQVKVPESFQGVPLSLAGSRRLQIQIKATEKKRFAPPLTAGGSKSGLRGGRWGCKQTVNLRWKGINIRMHLG